MGVILHSFFLPPSLLSCLPSFLSFSLGLVLNPLFSCLHLLCARNTSIITTFEVSQIEQFSFLRWTSQSNFHAQVYLSSFQWRCLVARAPFEKKSFALVHFVFFTCTTVLVTVVQETVVRLFWFCLPLIFQCPFNIVLLLWIFCLYIKNFE